jgi:hypothetical protein
MPSNNQSNNKSNSKTICVRITQTLEGWVDIEADSREEALETAYKRFVTQGEALPDMDDTCQLDFDVVDYNEGKCQYEQL